MLVLHLGETLYRDRSMARLSDAVFTGTAKNSVYLRVKNYHCVEPLF